MDKVFDAEGCDYDSDPAVADTLRGGIGDDELGAMGGSAKLYGEAGNDTLRDWGERKAWLYGEQA